MIVVVARAHTDAERRDELIRLGTTVAAASRQEAGCLNYALFQDMEDENAFVIVEEWRDETALREHFATPHIAAFMGAFPATLSAPPDVQFHTVASTMSLADVQRL